VSVHAPGGWRPGSGGKDVLSALDRARPGGSGSGRATREAPELQYGSPAAVLAAAAAAMAAPMAGATRPLTQRDLDTPVTVTLSETPSVLLLEKQGLAVAADSTEGAAVLAANKRYKGLVAAREAHADAANVSEAQTLPVLLKTREVQCGGAALVAKASQASAWDIADSFAALGQASAAAEEDDLPGSVLPAGQAVPTGDWVQREARVLGCAQWLPTVYCCCTGCVVPSWAPCTTLALAAGRRLVDAIPCCPCPHARHDCGCHSTGGTYAPHPPASSSHCKETSCLNC
jgi:hypothetical protein